MEDICEIIVLEGHLVAYWARINILISNKNYLPSVQLHLEKSALKDKKLGSQVFFYVHHSLN